jgi:hypothetical protein
MVPGRNVDCLSRVTSTGEDIYIVRKDGTNVHQVTDTPGEDEEFGEWGDTCSVGLGRAIDQSNA